MNRCYIYILLLASPIAISAMDTDNPNVQPSFSGSTIIPTPTESQEAVAEDTCTICLCEEDHEGQTDKTVTSCKHSFHTRCIDKWLAENSSCPVCRTTIGANHTIYHPNEEEGAQAALALANQHQHHDVVAGIYNEDAQAALAIARQSQPARILELYPDPLERLILESGIPANL